MDLQLCARSQQDSQVTEVDTTRRFVWRAWFLNQARFVSAGYKSFKNHRLPQAMIS
jgi:hypothetical protein